MGRGRDPVAPAKAAAAAFVFAAAAFVFAGGAATPDGVRVTPQTVRPGQLVSVSADTCVAPATAYSAAFSATSARLRERADTMQGLARVSSHAAPGTYAVTVRCVRGGPYNGTFVVGDPHPAVAPGAEGGGPAVPASEGAARTAWLFGALALVVTIAGAGLALARGHRGQSGH
ncbi:hypothetical protein GCM10017673_47490 [Streptosporangium violaceochromogenes]|nr:hypothetical protein GCM10017673_47490 [Streptosporangium violaceochromogenes]